MTWNDRGKKESRISVYSPCLFTVTLTDHRTRFRLLYRPPIFYLFFCSPHRGVGFVSMVRGQLSILNLLLVNETAACAKYGCGRGEFVAD